MKLTKYSRNRLYDTFAKWQVPKDFAEPMANYLIYGYGPGSCFTSILANDFAGAISHSHPANTIDAYKALVGWIQNCLPRECHGSYDVVADWTSYSSAERREILEKYGLVFTEEKEVWMALSDYPTKEPVLY